MSDWDGYAVPLANKFSYTNTFLHCPPFYDVSRGDEARNSTCDFVIATEVFEHVVPPANRAFINAFDLLKSGGHFIFTVPWTTALHTVEHFPNLHEYRIVRFDDDFVMVNRTKDGTYEVHSDLVFHGGPGETLEMRLYCRSDLESILAEVGFTDIRIFGEDHLEFGIINKHPWSLPILARKV